MTTVTLSTAGRTRTRQPARYRDLLAAEWIKLWSLRSTWGAFALILLAMVGLAVHAALATHAGWPDWPAERRAARSPLWDAFPTEAQMFVVLAASGVGAVAIGGEYASGLMRTTFAAVPRRGAVAAAKLTVLTGVLTLLGLLGAAAAFTVSQAILADVGANMSIGDHGALRGIAASALLVPLCALVGMALAALTRHTAPAIVAAATVLLLLPTAVDADERWSALIRHAMPVPAWQRLMEPTGPLPWINDPYPATVAWSWTTYAVWAAVAAMVTVLALHRREP
ncbi:ABC transporter permease [Verrucosispora sp. ts21]|uniref:ABC transporter permease n=1 Tax=Verrucosispora sp. ts21 TaxID=2069341 RepID=UPI000C884B05|nr:ABC transporter permease [Verrucosispora sp. ts21]PMR58124.1 ABC transporter permease [Verrucosispora sp. ts21]